MHPLKPAIKILLLIVVFFMGSSLMGVPFFVFAMAASTKAYIYMASFCLFLIFIALGVMSVFIKSLKSFYKYFLGLSVTIPIISFAAFWLTIRN